MGSVFSWLKDPKRRGFGVRMSNQRLTSTCVSALDWGSDLYYFYKVWRWSLGEYFPTANEQLACMMAIGSADGGGACGVAEAGQPCLCNGTTVAYDDVQLVTDSCDVSESLLVLGSLMDTCAAPRAVNASLFVLSVLFGSFVVGLLADVAKFFIVFLNDQGEDLLAAHWALVNATADGQADSPSINDNPAFENASGAVAAARGPAGKAKSDSWLDGSERWRIQRDQARHARLSGWVVVMSSLLEDVLQHIATFYVELWLKPEVLVGWSAVGSKVGSGTGSGTGFLSGMSTVALVSMFAGVLNTLVKLRNGSATARRGKLGELSRSDPAFQIDLRNVNASSCSGRLIETIQSCGTIGKDHMDDDDMELLFHTLSPSNPDMHELTLVGLGLCAEETRQLATDVLPYCKKLNMLALQSNDIDDEGAEALASALPKCPALEQLYLHKNKISDVGAQKILGVLSECHLETIKLDAQNLSEATKTAIQAAVADTRLV